MTVDPGLVFHLFDMDHSNDSSSSPPYTTQASTPVSIATYGASAPSSSATLPGRNSVMRLGSLGSSYASPSKAQHQQRLRPRPPPSAPQPVPAPSLPPSSRQRGGGANAASMSTDAAGPDSVYGDSSEGMWMSPATYSDSHEYFDASSEVGSTSSMSLDTCDSGFSEGGARRCRERRRSSSAQSSTDDEDTYLTDWQSRFGEERRRRVRAEETAAELKAQRESLSQQLRHLEQEAAAARQDRATADADELAVARMVAGVVGRAVAAEAAREAWSARVAMLHERLERMGRMEEAMERQRVAEGAQRETLRRQLTNGALAACCSALGVVAAYLIIIKTQHTSRASPAT